MSGNNIRTSDFVLALESIRLAWIKLAPDMLKSALSADIIWYEDPNKPPLKGINSVIQQWAADLSSQKDVEVTYDIIKQNNSNCIATWEASWVDRTDGEMHLEGVFYIELDDEGLIAEFRQWWL